MKKMMLVFSITASTLGMMNAQNVKTTAQMKTVVGTEGVQTPAARAKEKVSEISKMCTLTSDQIGKVTSVYTDFFTNQDAIKAQKSTLGAKEYDSKIIELKSQRDAALKATLTANQVAKLQSAKNEKDASNVAGRPAAK